MLIKAKMAFLDASGAVHRKGDTVDVNYFDPEIMEKLDKEEKKEVKAEAKEEKKAKAKKG